MKLFSFREKKDVPEEENVVAELDAVKDGPDDIVKGGPDDIVPVNVFQLFKYADRIDIALIIVGTICAMGVGVSLPIFSIILGDVYEDFGNPNGDIRAAGDKYALIFGLVGVGVFFAGSGQMGCFTIASERQTLRIRAHYLKAILFQEVEWFDYSKSGELVSKISENTVILRDAIGDKLGNLVQFLSMFLSGFMVGFILNWLLTLVILSITPFLAAGGYVMMRLASQQLGGSLGAYSKAGGVAAEAFSTIRTIASLGSERRVERRFRSYLSDAEKAGLRKSKLMGVGMGFTFGCYFLSYALAFWFGAKLVIDSSIDAADKFPIANASSPGCIILDSPTNTCLNLACQCGCYAEGASCYDGNTVVSVFFSVVIGAFALGQASPSITALANACTAAGKIFSVLDRKPKINQLEGDTMVSTQGHLKFENVSFSYPSRSSALIFSDLNLEMLPGTTVALVGGSGCGKSTVTQLVLRFYDPVSGNITLDGVNLRSLQPKWLRNNIGLVGQEPVLFATTIKHNIALGLPEGVVPTDELIEKAAKSANAYDYIMELPDKFNTFVGERGSSLSGGQKQRIAIARAIVRDPAILILDEATSALDNKSEIVVQKALDKLLESHNRTTIVIAHRLTTVRNASKIVVLGDGGVLEQGSHDELVQSNGHYSALLAAADRTSAEGTFSPVVEASSAIPLGKRFSSTSKIDFEELPEAVVIAEEEKTASSIDADVAIANLSPEEEKAELRKLEEQEILEVLGAQNKPHSEDSKGFFSSMFKKKNKAISYDVPLHRVFSFSYNERFIYIPAILSAAINGASLPVFSIVFTQISTVYFQPTVQLIRSESETYALYFVYFSIAIAIAYFGQSWLFGIIAEKMTTRIRSKLFSAMLRMEMGFFDRRANSVGVLTAKLSTDAALVKASLADRAALGVGNLTTVIVGLFIAFFYGWKLTLVLISLLPLVVIGGFLQIYVLGAISKEDEKAMKNANQILADGVSNIRTVTAFDLRNRLAAMYDEFLLGPTKQSIKRGAVVGLGFGFSQGVIFAVYSIAFWYGAVLIATDGYDFQTVLQVFFAVVMTGFGLGQASALAPDIARASEATSSVFRVIDRQSLIDPFAKEGLQLDDSVADAAEMTLDNVNFTYPSRTDAKVLSNFCLHFPHGKTTALVGMSGSGKSTVIQLVERFYDPDLGSIKFCSTELKDLNTRWLRTQLGLVSQEPQLFGGTIFDNIAEGLACHDNEDDFTVVPLEAVEKAAMDANAHGFIMEFPDGYDTQVGESGSMLSGGQKQRICLARCLLREPKVLLLDEATSALDNESEKVVQAALDRLMQEKRRTCIVIAHRLSSIQAADNIAVVHLGEIVEQGTHDELLARNGAYAKLWYAQIRR